MSAPHDASRPRIDAIRHDPGGPVVLHARVVGDHGGGPDKTVLRSARYAKAHGYRLAAAYLHPRGGSGIETIRRHADDLDCPLIELPETGPIDPRALWRLAAWCRRLNVAIFHGHDYKTNLLGIMLRRLHRMRLVTTVHGWVSTHGRSKLYYALDRRLQRRFDHVLAVSPDLADACRQLGVPDEKLTYLPNAIEPDVFRRRRSVIEARRELALPENKPIIGFVGRLNEEKGLDRAMRLLPELREKVPDCEFHLIGDGPSRSELTDRAAANALYPAVRFHGWQTNVSRWVEAFDALWLPSRAEGLPNAALEAMSLETPVALTNVGGASDLVDHGRCGVLLDDDEEHWVDPLAHLLNDTDERNRLARLGRQRIEQRFSFDARMRRVAAIYDELLGRTTRHAA